MELASTGKTEKSNTEPGSDESLRLRAVWVQTVALSGILFLMVMYTLYLAASLILPIVLALLLNLILSPVVRFMTRLHIPQTLSALLVMLSVAAIMAAGVYSLAAPASVWMQKAPSELRKLEYKLDWVKRPAEEIKEIKEQVNDMTSIGESPSDFSQAAESQPSFSLVNTVLSRTTDVIFGIAVMLILLFFLLASGDALLRNMIQVTSTFQNKKRVVETAYNIQRHVSVYLGTITLINIVVGIVIAVVLYLLNMPNPILWGTIVAVLNFVPYLGVAISIIIVGFASILTFDSLLQMLLPPVVILMVNVIEGQFLTPIIAGRRLELSPVAVFLSLVVLGWIWGIVGVLIAVPVLATIKLVCEQIEPLEPVATFLSRD